MPISDHIDRLLEEGPRLLGQLQGPIHSSNCPATAEAVQRYIVSGIMQPARGVMPGFGFINCGTPFRRSSIPGLIALVGGRDHGFQVVVGASATNPDREHYCNLVNIRGTVYYVDAYNRPGVISDRVTNYLRWARTFEYTTNFIIRLVPRDQADRASCR